MGSNYCLQENINCSYGMHLKALAVTTICIKIKTPTSDFHTPYKFEFRLLLVSK